MGRNLLVLALAWCALAAPLASCKPAPEQPVAQQPAQVGDNVLGLLNELAQVSRIQPEDPPDKQAARDAALRKAKDALLDAETPFNDRVSLACWLQGLGDQLSDKIVNTLAGESDGVAIPDARIIYALGMLIWNYAQQLSGNPFSWKAESREGIFAEKAVEVFQRASDIDPDNALFAITVAYADFFNTGRLNGTLISWSWEDNVQREASKRIEPMVKRFAEAKGGGGITGPPYFTPIYSWKAYSPQEAVGGLYDGVAPSSLFPACVVLIARDYSKQKQPEGIVMAVSAAEKMLDFRPEKYERLTAGAVSLRELAQTVELVMMDPGKRGEAAELAGRGRSLFKAITDDWINNIAVKYSKLMGKDNAACLRMEQKFVEKYKGNVQSQLKRLREFIGALKPEDINPDPPPAPW